MTEGAVLEEARAVADELGLPSWWFDEDATALVAGRDGRGRRRVFDHIGLRVMAASPHHVFAMMVLAGSTRDVDDLRRLAELAGVSSVEDAMQTCRDFYPDEPIS